MTPSRVTAHAIGSGCRLILVLALATGLARAHDARPNYVEIVEIETNTYTVSWKIPASVPGPVLPYPVLPDDCVSERQPAWHRAGPEILGRQSFACRYALSGRTVGIEFPGINPSLSTLYAVRFLGGEEHVQFLKPDEPNWLVPAAENRLAIAAEYMALGVEHIWIGIDHLLFVACLLFIAGTPRRLLVTITGFTLAHSITLALSALDLLRLPTPPIEAAIALSVLFMAWEIARGDRTSLTYRHPLTIATSFGLLHGFGFAAVLRDIGLPQTELPTALLFFNIGVEIGQLLFVAALLAVFFVLRPAARRLLPVGTDSAPHWATLTSPASYVIGSIASYWMIDRVAGFWVWPA